MKYPFRFGLAILLVCVSLFAQSNPSSTEKKQEPPAPTSSTQEQRPPDGAIRTNGDYGLGQGKKGTAYGALDVLSDNQGVNFGPYLKSVLDTVKRNWYNLIPESARAPIMKKGNVGIEFAILKDGGVKGMKLVYSSGDVALDRGAWGGIATSSPFPPLPTEFGGEYLALRMKFLYNPAPVKPADIVVSPASVQLASGATQQFSASVPGAANAAVNWSLSCAVAVCGSISAHGLYTAPSGIPSPSTVTVAATLATDPIKTGSAMVTVQPSRSK